MNDYLTMLVITAVTGVGGLALGEVAPSGWTALAVAVLAGMLFLVFRPAPGDRARKASAAAAAQGA